MSVNQIPRNKRGDPWFNDGNIILLTANLEAGGVAFKVHKSVLARHSAVFQSMFEDAEPPPDDETIDNCPLVPLPDLPSELSSLIKACYDGIGGSLQNRSIEDFFYVTGILRLSTKYCIAHLRTEAIKHLAQTWPYTLRGHDAMLEIAVKTPPVDGLSYPFVHPLHVLHLARETDVRILMPSALYFLSLYPLTDILRGDHAKLQIAHPSGLSNVLTAQDLQDYTLMYQYRISAMLDFVRRICSERRASDCTGGRACLKAFATLAAHLALEWVSRSGPLHFMVQGMDELASYPNACANCRKAFRQDVNAAREQLWNDLPTTVGLPSWQELEADLQAS